MPYQIQVYRVTDLQHSSVSLSAGSTVAGGVAAINMPGLDYGNATLTGIAYQATNWTDFSP